MVGRVFLQSSGGVSKGEKRKIGGRQTHELIAPRGDEGNKNKKTSQ